MTTPLELYQQSERLLIELRRLENRDDRSIDLAEEVSSRIWHHLSAEDHKLLNSRTGTVDRRCPNYKDLFLSKLGEYNILWSQHEKLRGDYAYALMLSEERREVIQWLIGDMESESPFLHDIIETMLVLPKTHINYNLEDVNVDAAVRLLSKFPRWVDMRLGLYEDLWPHTAREIITKLEDSRYWRCRLCGLHTSPCADVFCKFTCSCGGALEYQPCS